MMKKNKAFSLVEIMIVLAIIGVLMGLGIYAMTQLRRTLEADQAVQDFSSIIKETEARAKNNTVPNGTAKSQLISNNYGYLLKFSEAEGIVRWVCHKALSDGWQDVVNDIETKCEARESLIAASYGNIKMKPDNCNSVIIENLTERMYFFDNSTGVIGDCEVTVNLSNPSEYFRTLVFYDGNDSFAFIRK